MGAVTYLHYIPNAINGVLRAAEFRVPTTPVHVQLVCDEHAAVRGLNAHGVRQSDDYCRRERSTGRLLRFPISSSLVAPQPPPEATQGVTDGSEHCSWREGDTGAPVVHRASQDGCQDTTSLSRTN